MAKTTAKSDRRYGELLNQERSYEDLEKKSHKISTGSIKFDIYLDGGYSPGMARFGAEPEHGKSLQAMQWAESWIKYWKGKGRVLHFDTEGRISLLKINSSKITHEHFKKGDYRLFKYNVLDYICNMIEDCILNNPDDYKYFFIIDSLDMMIVEADQGKTYSEFEKIGAAQSMATILMKRIGVYLQDREHHLHILSQVRANINTANPNSPKTKTSGANALRHAADISGEIIKNWSEMEIYENPKGATKAEKGRIIGHDCTIKFIKTGNEKTGQIIRVPILHGHGVWKEREATDMLLEYQQVLKSGAWLDMNDDFAKNLSERVTKKRRNAFCIKMYTEKRDEAKNKVSREALKQECIDAALKEVKDFEVEKRWQGYEALFKYVSTTPDVTDAIGDIFIETLLPDQVAKDDDSDEFEEVTIRRKKSDAETQEENKQ